MNVERDHSGQDNEGGWDRLAAELRACREAQRRAWGDLDDATLGRYLAGAVTGEEHQQIEMALAERPELRLLTDLVRDVLAEFEPTPAIPVVTPIAQPAKAPRILSFAEARNRLPRGSPLGRLWNGKGGAWVAAAVLLLVLGATGLALPRSGSISAGSGDQVTGRGSTLVRYQGGLASARPVPALITFAPDGRLLPSTEPPQVRLWDGIPVPARSPIAAVSDSVPPDVPRPGERNPLAEEVLPRPRRLVAWHPPIAIGARDRRSSQSPYLNLASSNIYFVEAGKTGDLTRAAAAYTRAHATCCQALGPNHPATLQVSNNLANVYQVALVPATPLALESAPVHLRRPGVALKKAKGRSESGWREGTRVLREQILNQTPPELRREVVPVLVSALQQATTSTERIPYVEALAALGPAAAVAIPTLTRNLKATDDPRERRAVLFALGQLGPAGRSAVPVLVKHLRGHCPIGRSSAADALVSLGPVALPVVSREARSRDACPLLAQVEKRLRGPEGRCGILDEGHCFTVRRLSTALPEIRRLASGLGGGRGVDVLIHTFPVGAFRKKQASKEARTSGILIWASRDGAQVEVRIAPTVRLAPSSPAGAEPGQATRAITQVVRQNFQAGEHDRALSEVLRLLTPAP